MGPAPQGGELTLTRDNFFFNAEFQGACSPACSFLSASRRFTCPLALKPDRTSFKARSQHSPGSPLTAAARPGRWAQRALETLCDARATCTVRPWASPKRRGRAGPASPGSRSPRGRPAARGGKNPRSSQNTQTHFTRVDTSFCRGRSTRKPTDKTGDVGAQGASIMISKAIPLATLTAGARPALFHEGSGSRGQNRCTKERGVEAAETKNCCGRPSASPELPRHRSGRTTGTRPRLQRPSAGHGAGGGVRRPGRGRAAPGPVRPPPAGP